MNNTEKMMPCPFCGSQPRKQRTGLSEVYAYADKVVYTCPKCGCSRGAVGDTSKGGYADNSKVDEQAKQAWNNRAPTPPKPIYDEAAERKLFESVQDDEGGNIDRDSMGDYENPYIQSAWDGWQACAQSRAKAGEDE